MSRFVRASKYRHVFGTPNKREQSYDNCKTTRNAWDSNVIKVNPYFASVNWQASGGGAFAIIPLNKPGKLSNDMPLVTGHKADVLDTDFHPFNDYIVASGSEDCKVMVWSIPEGGLTSNLNDPVLTLNGHGRKVGHVLFHPTVDNLLASSSADLTIKLWDVTTGQEKQTLSGMLDFVTDLSWNYTGALLSTVSRDKKLRIFDVRSGKIAQETDGHQGVKGSRCAWLGNTDRIATSGFSKTSDRQLYLWDNRNFGDAIKKDNLDTSSGVLMLFYDADTTMLYVGGKGDGNIRYYEYADDSLHYLAEYKSADPQRGLAFLPKRAVSVSDIETARCYKITPTLIEPISFRVPRKSDIFQTDLYPPALSDEPALTIPEFFSGKTANPKTVSLEGGFKATGKKEFKTAVTEEAPKKDILNPKTEKEYQESFHHLRKENEQLKNELAQAQVRIRQLELQTKN